MIARALLGSLVLLLAACAGPKGPGESGQPVYYDPLRGISSDGLVYPRPR